MRRRRELVLLSVWGLFSFAIGCNSCGKASSDPNTILHVSFDPTRELYDDVNRALTDRWQKENGTALNVQQSHGGSGKQARAVIDGLEADIVSLALSFDVDAISTKSSLLPVEWAARLPRSSAPFASTVVFVVRKGNPKQIADWMDLAKPGVSVITPNPKTSGGARWNYLAAWAFALEQPGGNDASAQQLLSGIYRNVPVLDSGARGSATTFAERGMGDVLVTWESDALLLTHGPKGSNLQIVAPSVSILAELPVVVVEQNVDKHGTRKAAEAYVQFLFGEEGQELAAKHYFRPTDPAVFARHATEFASTRLLTLHERFGSWAKVHDQHFRDGGLFDQIYRPAGAP